MNHDAELAMTAITLIVVALLVLVLSGPCRFLFSIVLRLWPF